MTKTRRWLLWGLILSPVAFLPTTFLVSRLWLNHHLSRELAFGSFRMRLDNPNLGWNLNFNADAVEIDAPRLSFRTGRISTDARIWNSIASFKPSVLMTIDSVGLDVEPGSLDGPERERRRERRRAPTFLNLRVPIEFKVTAARFDLSTGGRKTVTVRDLAFASDGPKGVALEAAGIGIRNPRDSTLPGDSSLLEMAGSYRASARWFGKSVRYVARAEFPGGDYLRWEGERRKSDLRDGKDSLDARMDDLSRLAPLFGSKGPPEITGMEIQASLQAGKNKEAAVRAAFNTPRIWEIGPQRVEWTGGFADSAGRMTLKSHGLTDEELYLQGRFRLPSLDSGLAGVPEALTASLAGYTRGFRFRIGGRILPGDAEIRRLRIQPGLRLDAEVRTRDSSVVHGRAFRAPDPGRPGDSSWQCDFAGTVDPRESWVHAWVDTNVSFTRARVSGRAGRKGLEVEAWVKQPRAYGSAADSVHAVQNINRTGYYLTASKVYAKEGIWPVTGQVEWGRRKPGRHGRRKVALVFRTSHPRFGSAEYAMDRPKSMRVRVDSLDCLHLPYVRLRKLIALKPMVTGGFEWDWLARTGSIDAKATLSYGGRPLEAAARGDWDAGLLRTETADVSFSGSSLHASGGLRLHGRQFWEMCEAEIKDVESLSLDAERFDAASLAGFLGDGFPLLRGTLDGKLSYSDTSGFHGSYRMRNLDLAPLRKLASIPRIDLIGRGEGLAIDARTASEEYPWLNDSLHAEVDDLFGAAPGVSLDMASDNGLTARVRGSTPGFRGLDASFSVAGEAELPGEAGTIRNLSLNGRFRAPFAKDILEKLVLDSGTFAGRYAVPGLDTQSVSGSVSMRDGRLRIPDLQASSAGRVTLSGEADAQVAAGEPRMTAVLHGGDFAVRWPGIQKLTLGRADASLRMDARGLFAKASVSNAGFSLSKPPISMRGDLENVQVEYIRPRGTGSADGLGTASVPKIKVRTRLSNFLFKHKIGFRELQHSIRTVKTDKRKKRVKPVDLQLNLETAGSSNRIETDVLRMVFAGDLSVKGVYPYTLLTGEFSALSGELGQTSQSYDITDFDLKWQNATVEEGRISVEGGKRLRADCRPETQRTCNVYVKLAGRLDEMAFTYDSDCGSNSGETMEPAALINSVSRGCYSDEYVAGAGGGNYGEAVFVLLEPTINEKLTSVGDRFSGGWIKRTSVSGIGTAVSGDTVGAEPIAIGVETKEKWGVSVKAKAGYHPEKKVQNPWENKVSVEWRPPLEKASKSSEWKRAVRDRVTLEASAETRPDEKVNEQNREEVRKQVGIRYRYKFWNLW